MQIRVYPLSDYLEAMNVPKKLAQLPSQTKHHAIYKKVGEIIEYLGEAARGGEKDKGTRSQGNGFTYCPHCGSKL